MLTIFSDKSASCIKVISEHMCSFPRLSLSELSTLNVVCLSATVLRGQKTCEFFFLRLADKCLANMNALYIPVVLLPNYNRTAVQTSDTNHDT
jgi:hypothetical protein